MSRPAHRLSTFPPQAAVQRAGDVAASASASGATDMRLPSLGDRRGTALGALDATVPDAALEADTVPVEAGEPSVEPVASSDEVLTPSVLLVHDSPAARSALTLLLRDEGFEARAVDSGRFLDEISTTAPSVVLLQPPGSLEFGLEMLRRIRQRHQQPVIILSPLDSSSAKARSLEQGADDYLTTPFDPDELTARVRAVLRRDQRNSRSVAPLIVGDLSIDFERRILSRKGTVVPLGRTEWLVLRHLARHPGKVVLNTELLSAIWGEGYADDLQVLRICISRLRHKLGATRRGGGPIRTFHNVGYALEID